MANTIITYGGGEIMEGVFQGIAAFLNGGSFLKTTIRLSGTIGIALASLMLIFGDLSAFLKKFFIPFFVILHLLLLPTGNVLIKDLVTKHTYAVKGVPIALAVTAGSLSSLMDGFTQGVEKVFRLPDDLQYTKTGFLFASRMILKAKNPSLEDPVFQENMKEFVSQCVTYDALIGIKYTLKDLMTSENVWKLVSENASPARSIVYRDGKGSAKICPCKEVAPQLDKGFKSAASVLKHLPVSLTYLLKQSETAQDLVRQQMMIAALQSSIAQKNEELGNMNTLFALQRAKTQQRTTYQTLGFLAADNLPLMKTTIEALTYGIFLFIIPLCLLPLGLRFLSQWVRLVMWVHLWAPLYAILNFMMTLSAQSRLSGLGIKSLTLGTSSTITEINEDLSVMAGYLSLMIPVMAWGLLKANAQAFTSLASSLGSVANSAATTAAVEQSTGNYSFGNIQQGSVQIDNTTSGQHQTSPTYQSGAFTEGDGEVQMTTSAGGRHFMSVANSNLRSGINLSESASESFSRLSSDSLVTSQGQMRASQQSQADAYRQLVTFGEHQAHQQSLGESWAQSHSSGYNENANKVFMAAQDFSKTHGLDVSTAAKVLGAASLGVDYKFFKANVGGEMTRSAVTQDVYNEARQFAERNELQDSFSRGVQNLTDQRGSYTDETAQRLGKEVSGSLEKSSSYRQESSLSLQHAQQFQTAANWTKQNGYTLNENANQDYIEWLAKQPSHGGRGTLGIQGARTVIAHQPDLNRSYQRLFVEERQQGIMSQALRESSLPTTAQDIQTQYQNSPSSFRERLPSSGPLDQVMVQSETSLVKGPERIHQEIGDLQGHIKNDTGRIDQNLDQRKTAIKQNAERTQNVVEVNHEKGLGQIEPLSNHEFPHAQQTKWGNIPTIPQNKKKS